MAYTVLLNNIINESGLSVKEIAKRCNQYGVKITASYISTLKNDTNNRTPSDEVSRAIAKACNFEDENALILEAYIDNAPEEFKGVIDFIRDTTLYTVFGLFENSFPKEIIDKAKEDFKAMPLYKIVQMMNQDRNRIIEKGFGVMNYTSISTDDELTIKQEISTLPFFDVDDDSMFPILPKGSKVSLEHYEIKAIKDGDIVALGEKETKNIYYRKIAFLDDEHTKFMLYPLNTNYPTEKLSITDVIIIGKVKNVTTELK